MRQKIDHARAQFGMWAFWVGMFILAGFGWITKTEITDVIEVNSIRVVALSDVVRDEAHGDRSCIVSATESDSIHPGDELFVAADLIFLGDVKGRYRTYIRNQTAGRNVYDDKAWSDPFPYTAGKRYCRYQTLAWWIGNGGQPEMGPGAYRLVTSWQFDLDRGRAVSGQYPSEPFVIVDDSDLPE